MAPIKRLGAYRFTDACRRALQQAREEATRLRQPYVATEHILLALLAQRDGEPSRILTALGLKLSAVRSEVELAGSREPATGSRGLDLPYTSRAKAVLEHAMDEAGALEDPAVDTVHLLMGVMRETRSHAAQILQRHGAAAGDVRAAHRSGGGAEADLRLKLDDGSDTLIYQQIVDQVREAIATGRIRAGERLPTVRRLADELEIAPGTVARAYAELESSGAVVTDGARGTYVALAGRRAEGGERPAVSIRDLLRPVIVAAYHLGASAPEVRAALDQAMKDIYPDAA